MLIPKHWLPKVTCLAPASKHMVWIWALKKHFAPRKETEDGTLTDGISQYSKHDVSILSKDDGDSNSND
jgi:hypothetical protein